VGKKKIGYFVGKKKKREREAKFLCTSQR
jgi:hypothetical protein